MLGVPGMVLVTSTVWSGLTLLFRETAALQDVQVSVAVTRPVFAYAVTTEAIPPRQRAATTPVTLSSLFRRLAILLIICGLSPLDLSQGPATGAGVQLWLRETPRTRRSAFPSCPAFQ